MFHDSLPPCVSPSLHITSCQCTIEDHSIIYLTFTIYLDPCQLDELSALFLDMNGWDPSRNDIMQECYSAAYSAKILLR